MRKLSVVAVGVALAVVVAACGGSDDDKPAGKAAASGKLEGSIDVWIMDPGSPKIQDVVKQYGTDFEAAHPGTTIDVQFVPWAQAHDKFVTAIAGGKVPDVAEMGTTWTPEFVAMLIAGGWTYNSIIATKPELEKKIGTELTPAGPSGESTAFAGGSHLVQFQESKDKELGAAFVDFMLKPAQLNEFTSEIGYLPGTTDGVKASGYLEDPQRKPFTEQLLDHSAVYPPSPKWGGLEGANIFDGEIQKVMKGKTTSQQAVADLAKKMDEEFAG